MTKENKNEIVGYLTEEFKESNAIVICGFNAVSHSDFEGLRQEASAAGVKVQVAKNTLATKAFEKAGLDTNKITNNNIFLWSEDQIAACKIADKFANANKEKFEIKSGYIEGKQADTAMINSYAKLPGRDELIGMLLSVWTAPARNFVTGLDNLRSKLEEAA